ncbi:MAG: hypothetical protein HYY34_02315 [Chloroflexi bacterium]|nr:hypothetical protein [Chloroflexota bacterium]
MTAGRLRRHLRELETRGRERLASFDGPIEVRRSLDMRYGEQIFEIQVDLEGLELGSRKLIDEVVERFHRRHDELYAYSAPGQDVVIVNVRVAVVGFLSERPVRKGLAVARHRSRAPVRRRRAYLGGWREVSVYAMDTLTPGQVIDGAAIVESDMTTVLIRDGERLSVMPEGWLDIRL